MEIKFVIQKGNLDIYYCTQHKSLLTYSFNAASKYATFNNAMKAFQKANLDRSIWKIKEVRINTSKPKKVSS